MLIVRLNFKGDELRAIETDDGRRWPIPTKAKTVTYNPEGQATGLLESVDVVDRVAAVFPDLDRNAFAVLYAIAFEAATTALERHAQEVREAVVDFIAKSRRLEEEDAEEEESEGAYLPQL